MRFMFGYKFSNFFSIFNLSSAKSFLIRYLFAIFHPLTLRIEPKVDV